MSQVAATAGWQSQTRAGLSTLRRQPIFFHPATQFPRAANLLMQQRRTSVRTFTATDAEINIMIDPRRNAANTDNSTHGANSSSGASRSSRLSSGRATRERIAGSAVNAGTSDSFRRGAPTGTTLSAHVNRGAIPAPPNATASGHRSAATLLEIKEDMVVAIGYKKQMNKASEMNAFVTLKEQAKSAYTQVRDKIEKSTNAMSAKDKKETLGLKIRVTQSLEEIRKTHFANRPVI